VKPAVLLACRTHHRCAGGGFVDLANTADNNALTAAADALADRMLFWRQGGSSLERLLQNAAAPEGLLRQSWPPRTDVNTQR
jgi:hypothetical protein